MKTKSRYRKLNYFLD